MSTGVQAKLHRVRPRAKNILKVYREIGNNPLPKSQLLNMSDLKLFKRQMKTITPILVKDQHKEGSRRKEY